MNQAAKPGHLAGGGPISAPMTEQRREALAKASRRAAAERKAKGTQPVQLDWRAK